MLSTQKWRGNESSSCSCAKRASGGLLLLGLRTRKTKMPMPPNSCRRPQPRTSRTLQPPPPPRLAPRPPTLQVASREQERGAATPPPLPSAPPPPPTPGVPRLGSHGDHVGPRRRPCRPLPLRPPNPPGLFWFPPVDPELLRGLVLVLVAMSLFVALLLMARTWTPLPEREV